MALKPVTIAATVATAGTRIQVSTAATPIAWVRFSAKHSNTGDVYVGDNTVSSAKYIAHVHVTENPGLEIEGNDGGFRTTGNQLLLSDFYLDAENNGAVCMVSYMERVG